MKFIGLDRSSAALQGTISRCLPMDLSQRASNTANPSKATKTVLLYILKTITLPTKSRPNINPPPSRHLLRQWGQKFTSRWLPSVRQTTNWESRDWKNRFASINWSCCSKNRDWDSSRKRPNGSRSLFTPSLRCATNWVSITVKSWSWIDWAMILKGKPKFVGITWKILSAISFKITS